MEKILVTGGAGYVGSELVPELLKGGYAVNVLDLMLYGEDVLDSHPKLKVFKGDIRDIALVEKAVNGCKSVIHLACISNDPSFELDPKLGRDINLDAFEPLVIASKKARVEKFIYASSSSVYGIKENIIVDESTPLDPLTDYSKFKAECELILNSHITENFIGVCLRPATVCGYAKRQRLDVVVNILTNLAFHKRAMTVFGGPQLRPNIHIKDMVRSYIHVLTSPNRAINGEAFNVGYENYSVDKIAELVKDVIGEDVVLEKIPTNDNRSYHISSTKIVEQLGFSFQHSIKEAIEDLKIAFQKGLLPESLSNKKYFNIEMMKYFGLK
jgi:nucleoside-diphosphate-sugar epimerase